MNIITIKTLMHMHIEAKCFNQIYHMDFDLQWKKQKNLLDSSLQTNTNEL
jgi:hypothetical protein